MSAPQFEVLWAEVAIRDLEQIVDYVGREAPMASERIFNAVVERSRTLDIMPFEASRGWRLSERQRHALGFPRVRDRDEEASRVQAVLTRSGIPSPSPEGAMDESHRHFVARWVLRSERRSPGSWREIDSFYSESPIHS